MPIYQVKTKNERALVEYEAAQRVVLADAHYSEKYPAPDAHAIEQAHRISHPAHQKYAKDATT